MRKEFLNASVFTCTQLFLYSLDVDALVLVLVLVLDWIFVSFVLLFFVLRKKKKEFQL